VPVVQPVTKSLMSDFGACGPSLGQGTRLTTGSDPWRCGPERVRPFVQRRSDLAAEVRLVRGRRRGDSRSTQREYATASGTTARDAHLVNGRSWVRAPQRPPMGCLRFLGHVNPQTAPLVLSLVVGRGIQLEMSDRDAVLVDQPDVEICHQDHDASGAVRSSRPDVVELRAATKGEAALPVDAVGGHLVWAPPLSR
jgi:hypothetical protein